MPNTGSTSSQPTTDPPTQTGVTCVLIVKNEAKRIERCLKSLDFAQAIVVVDDESQDATVQICKAHGAEVLVHRSEGNFDAQRNLGTARAKTPWVLQLDADEVVPSALAQEIRHRLEREGGQAPTVAYRIIRRNHFLGRLMRHGGWAKHGSVKLFRKGSARYMGQGIHEQLQVDGAIGTLQSAIDHYPLSSIEQFVNRQNFYTSVEAHQLKERVGRDQQRHGKLAPLIRFVKIFLKIYIKKRAFLDGRHGLIFSLLYGWIGFVQWAKVWELEQNKSEEIINNQIPTTQ